MYLCIAFFLSIARSRNGDWTNICHTSEAAHEGRKETIRCVGLRYVVLGGHVIYSMWWYKLRHGVLFLLLHSASGREEG